MNFLVYVPNCSRKDLEATAKVAGLTVVLGEHDAMEGVNGPQGMTGGVMINPNPSPTSPLMHVIPDQQVWVPSVLKDENGASRYWVGFWKDKPPLENEIRRPYTQAGPLVQFGSQRWKIPTPDTVDARAVYADDGTMRWETVRQFSWMCDEANAIRDEYMEQFSLRQLVFKTEPSVQINWLLKLLQVNYRILPEVAVHLDMWIGKDHIMDTFLSTLGLYRKDAA